MRTARKDLTACKDPVSMTALLFSVPELGFTLQNQIVSAFVWTAMATQQWIRISLMLDS
jgi:hypothetical protein